MVEPDTQLVVRTTHRPDAVTDPLKPPGAPLPLPGQEVVGLVAAARVRQAHRLGDNLCLHVHHSPALRHKHPDSRLAEAT